MIGRHIAILSMILISLTSMKSNAQDVQFQASANKTTLAVGERFQVTFSINAGADQFQPPRFNGFRILSGPNQSTNMQFVNGRSSYTIAYSYVLMAMKEGSFQIAPASIRVGSDTYQSNDLSIEVVPGGSSNQNQSTPKQNPNAQSSAGDAKDGIFITASISNGKPFVGEQAIVTYKLYFNQNIVDNSFTTLPNMTGFWSQDIDVDNSKRITEVVDGMRYNVAILKKSLVIPQRAGDLELDPLEMELVVQKQVQSRSRNLFDQFFGNYQNVKIKVRSQAVRVKVQALPSGKPNDFDGAVGNFKIELAADRTQIPSNESINITYKISGKGNLKLMKEPEIAFPSDFEVYDPEVNDQISVNSNGMSGSRTYQYLTIPRHKGNFSIEPVRFSYFDPQQEKYISLSTESLDFSISQGKDDGPAGVVNYGNTSKEDIKVLGQDIRFIKQKTELIQAGHSFYGTILYYLLWLSPIPLFFIALLAYRKFRETRSDERYMRASRANKMAVKRLSTAKKLMNQDSKKFYEEIFKAVYGFYADKFSIDTASLNKDHIRQNLQQKGVSEVMIERSEALLSNCEMARFAPVESTSEGEVYNEAVDVISNIQKELK